MKCEICKDNKATVMVTLDDSSILYQYRISYRCMECAERAKRSHENIQIDKL